MGAWECRPVESAVGERIVSCMVVVGGTTVVGVMCVGTVGVFCNVFCIGMVGVFCSVVCVGMGVFWTGNVGGVPQRLAAGTKRGETSGRVVVLVVVLCVLLLVCTAAENAGRCRCSGWWGCAVRGTPRGEKSGGAGPGAGAGVCVVCVLCRGVLCVFTALLWAWPPPPPPTATALLRGRS